MTEEELIQKAKGYTLIDCPSYASTLDLLRWATDRLEARIAENARLREALGQKLSCGPCLAAAWRPTTDLRWARHRSALQQRWEAEDGLSEWRDVPTVTE